MDETHNAESVAPCRVKLGLCGEVRDGHTFFLSVEERSGGQALMDGEDVDMPWLRASCSCGWRDHGYNRVTIEENAWWRWRKHVTKVPHNDG